MASPQQIRKVSYGKILLPERRLLPDDLLYGRIEPVILVARTTVRRLTRRSFISRIGVAPISGGFAAAVIGDARGQIQSGLTDADPIDVEEHGRGGGPRARTYVTDSDPSDRQDFGRGGFTSSYDTDNSDPSSYVTTRGMPLGGVSDRDAGQNGDPWGHGRGETAGGYTDSDSGRYGDHAGRGRGPGLTGLTDSDSKDSAGNGRGTR